MKSKFFYLFCSNPFFRKRKSHIHTALDASVKIKLKADSPLHKAINSVGEHLNEVFVVSGTTVEVTDNLKAQGEFSIVVEGTLSLKI